LRGEITYVAIRRNAPFGETRRRVDFALETLKLTPKLEVPEKALEEA
jgi:hypothetical protein